MQYKIVDNQYGVSVVRTDDDGTIWWIPMNEANTDYQAYLAWLAEGNQPEEAGA